MFLWTVTLALLKVQYTSELWKHNYVIIFMSFTTNVESVEAHQRSFDRGIQIGHQRRNKVGLFPLLPL